MVSTGRVNLHELGFYSVWNKYTPDPAFRNRYPDTDIPVLLLSGE